MCRHQFYLFASVFCIVIALLVLQPNASGQEPPTASASPAPSASAEATKKQHEFQFHFDSGDDAIPADVRAKLSPEQLFEIEMARAKNHKDSDSSSIVPLLVPILVPISMFAMVVAIVVITTMSRQRQRQLTHETIRQMVEKGQPVPPQLFYGEKHARPRNDLRRGLLCSAVGLGLIIYLLAEHDEDWGIGFIPLLVGIGYIIIWKMQGMPRDDAAPR